MDIETKQKIEKYAKSFRWTPDGFYWEHTLQTRKFALIIQKQVGGDKDIVEVAALLHDIGKAKLRAPGHEEVSAELARQFLERIGFDRNKIEKITQTIKNDEADLLAAKILRTADNMSLIMDDSGGREWFFKNILGNDKKRILEELEKSYSEIRFEFAQEFVAKRYKKLIISYKDKR